VASAEAPATAAALRVRALDGAADQRDLRGFGEADVTHLDPLVRRATARGLARLRDPGGIPHLVRLLADRDGPTVAFAAYGLGELCTGHESKIVPSLITRAASFAGPARDPKAPPVANAQPEAAFALARALGHCPAEAAEDALRGWLQNDGPWASAAALGLGDQASRRKLSDPSIIALLAAAEKGLGDALYPFSRTTLEGASSARVREVAETVLTKGAPQPSRIFAVRALGRTDASAVPTLSAVLQRPDDGVGKDATDVERAEAARALGRLGPDGQAALSVSLPRLAPAKNASAVALLGLVADPFGPLTTVLEELRPPVASTTLDDLASLAAPADAPASVKLRVTKLRCASAQLRADTNLDDPLLRGCDADAAGEWGKLALLTVVARRSLADTARRAILMDASVSPSARVRAKVMELVGAHAELENGWSVLKAGLEHPHGGTVSAAADALAKRRDLWRPDEGGSKKLGVPSREELVKTVAAALARPFPADETEVRLSLIELAGLIKEPSLTKELASACTSKARAVRDRARRALAQVAPGNEALTKSCDAPLSAPAAELASESALGITTVTFQTDAGELKLRVGENDSPAATARFVELARDGFFKGMAVHRVVPGFVVQFGDRAGDGTGGANRDPLRCETSPRPFEPLTVGVALAGRDTGSSQFFVTLSRVPHLDGAYTTLGRASGDWAAVTEGDVIREVTVTRTR
jgi:cyclophilin family peptidyl-prolyl cis-trans isomerase